MLYDASMLGDMVVLERFTLPQTVTVALSRSVAGLDQSAFVLVGGRGGRPRRSSCDEVEGACRRPRCRRGFSHWRRTRPIKLRGCPLLRHHTLDARPQGNWAPPRPAWTKTRPGTPARLRLHSSQRHSTSSAGDPLCYRPDFRSKAGVPALHILPSYQPGDPPLNHPSTPSLLTQGQPPHPSSTLAASRLHKLHSL